MSFDEGVYNARTIEKCNLTLNEIRSPIQRTTKYSPDGQARDLECTAVEGQLFSIVNTLSGRCPDAAIEVTSISLVSSFHSPAEVPNSVQ